MVRPPKPVRHPSFQGFVQKCCQRRFFNLTRSVIKNVPVPGKDGHMRDVAAIKLLQQFLLRSRPAAIQIDNHEVRAPFVPFVQGDRAPRLPLGIESALAVNEDVVGLPFCRAVFHAVARNERAVLTVA